MSKSQELGETSNLVSFVSYKHLAIYAYETTKNKGQHRHAVGDL